jgi:glucan-binding YG repeat protein
MVVNSWILDEKEENGKTVEKWYYAKPNGAIVVNDSRVISGKKYYFDSTGLCTNPYQ